MTTIAQQLGQLEQDIYALAKRPSSEVLLAIDSRISAIRAAVGGEGEEMAWVIKNTTVGPDEPAHELDYIGSEIDKLPVGTRLYASPPATVDVEALLELVNGWRNHALKWPREADKINLCADELAALIGGSK